MLPSGSEAEVILFVRAQILAAAVLLALPVVKSFTLGTTDPLVGHCRRRDVRRAGRAVADYQPGSGPHHGERGGAVRVTRGADISGACRSRRLGMSRSLRLPVARKPGSALIRATAAGRAGLTGAFLIPPGHIAELVKGFGPMPLMVALYVMGKLRIRAADARVARQHSLRDALTEIGNAACFTTDRLAILKLAETTAREQVGMTPSSDR